MKTITDNSLVNSVKAVWLVRGAAGCLLFFALGHSIGHFTRHQVADPQAQAVLLQMMTHKFDMFGQMRSYDENYTGMSLNLIFTLLAFAVLLLVIAKHLQAAPQMSKLLLAVVGLCVAGFAATSFMYFFPVPAFSCVGACVCIVLAIRQLPS
ncbi:hypothetical protein SAMN05421780_102379 [Flexibacter flexilis DSM 6793]|uniref:DUF4064 domain-containing protein n=1 Tax=Flexibacter flexilis DSM 6793 TaxID=927664 RepID=A0A1I1G5E5_9BACT|nr:hypothetical protein [Flexibacter flexilis]SFC04513.1 hypothetical protein SAMN05421780_102379 [Flexibacter flexilis DSM 6793]